MARELGFALCGVAPAAASEHCEHVVQWIEAGRHGSMRWLAEHLEQRLDPGTFLPGAQSVICVADHLGPAQGGSAAPAHGAARGRIARYAQVDDYHVVLKRRLHRLADLLREQHPTETFRVCVDTAPVLEREVHQRAGLGWVGKNTMLIHPLRGSHLLLGEIVTTLPLEPDSREPDHCGSCTRCIDACPTQCITPYQLDASRCISYLTIEHREGIDTSLHWAMGEWLYGCDICQEVCPYNAPIRGRVSEMPAQPYGSGRETSLDALAVLGWTEDDRRATFTRSAMKRAKLRQMKRNALIVLGNLLEDRTDRAEVLNRIESIAQNPAEDAMVRQTARQVLGRHKVGELQAG